MEDVGIAMSLPPAEARALCQKLFDAYVAEHGAEPRYNEFIRLMLPQGVSRSMARKTIEHLRSTPVSQEEDTMPEPIAETDDPTAGERTRELGQIKAQLASLERYTRDLEGQLREALKVVDADHGLPGAIGGKCTVREP